MRSQEWQIVTPEAVVLSLPTAGLGSRLLARGLDVLIQGAAIAALAIVATVFAGVASGLGGSGAAGTIVFVFVLVVATMIWLGYPIAFETLWRGRTPGKAALGLRVVTDDGAPIRFRHALVRGVLALVDVWLVAGSIGVVTMLVSRHEQRFGDMAAGTIVVRERSGAPAPLATVFGPPPGCEEYVANLDVSGIDAGEYEAARSFLLRAGAMGPGARADLAARLATPLVHRLHHTPPPWMGPELWLACLAAAYQRRHGGPWQAGYAGYPGYPGYPGSAGGGAFAGGGGYGGYGGTGGSGGPGDYSPPPDAVPVPSPAPPGDGFSPPA